MQETCNNCFGSKKCNTILCQAKTGKHKCCTITVTYKTKYSGKNFNLVKRFLKLLVRNLIQNKGCKN